MEALSGLNLQYIDMTYLEEMSDGCNEFICEMTTVFLEQMPQIINQMHSHMSNDDYQSLCSTVHKAKSAINIMGIKPLADLIAKFEKKKACKDSSNIKDFITKFEAISHEAILEVKNVLNYIERKV